MKILLLLLFLFLGFGALSAQHRTESAANKSPVKNPSFTILYFINLDNCVTCEIRRVNSDITELSNLPNSQVIAVVHSLRKDDVFIYKQNITADSAVWDSSEITARYQIQTYPSVVVLNSMDDVLYTFPDFTYDERMEKLFPTILTTFPYKDIPGVALERSEKGVLGQAQSPYINFKDSTLWTIDALRNSIMVYSLRTGAFIRSIGRSEALNSYYGKSLPTDLLQDFKRKKTPLSTLEYIAPLKESNGYAALILLVESVKFDTIYKARAKDTTPQIQAYISSTRVLDLQPNVDSVPHIFTPVGTDFTTMYLKYREPFYYTNIKYRNPNIVHTYPDDTTYLFYLTTSPSMNGGKFFLPSSKLANYFSFKQPIRSPGILEYNSTQDMFVFANPWNTIYCLSTPKEEITPIKPIGAFSHTFVNYKPTPALLGGTPPSENLTSFMNDILSNSKGYYILVQVNNKQRVANHCAIQEYSWSGKFIREIPITFDHHNSLLIEDNKLSVMHLIGCTEHELYLLGKTSLNGWEIKILPI